MAEIEQSKLDLELPNSRASARNPEANQEHQSGTGTAFDVLTADANALQRVA